MITVLVTGAAGYIGSHTVNQLLYAGHNVVGIDNLSNGYRNSLPRDQQFETNPSFYFYHMDIRDKINLKMLFKKHQIFCVIHLAAKAIVEESFQEQKAYYENNVNGTKVLLEVCKEFQVKNLIFSSSSTVYGNSNGTINLSESATVCPINPYGHTKLLCEQLIREFSPWIGSIIFRLFNVAGASVDLVNGPRGHGSGRIFYNLSQAAIQNSDFTINGNNYSTYDGTCVRDYIHVVDVASILTEAVKSLLSRSVTLNQSLLLNCGYGYGYSIKEIVEKFKTHTESDIQIKWGPRRLGDPEYLVGKNSLLIKTFSWTSQFNDPYKSICQSTYQWCRNQLLFNRLSI